MNDRDEILAAVQFVWPSDRTRWSVDGDLPKLERFYRLAQAAAYERAAQMCEQSDRYRGDYFAEKVRALKEESA